MMHVTMNDLPGYEIEEVLGEVFGLTVRSRNVGSQIGASLKSVVGGELKGMTKMLAEGRVHAQERLVDEAEAKGANAIIAFRFDTWSWARRGRRSAPTGPRYERRKLRTINRYRPAHVLRPARRDRLLQRTVREFAEEEVAPVAEELDRTKAFPYELVAQMGELGWMGIPFPEEVGGAGGTSLQYAIAVEELTRVDSRVAITLCAHTSLGTQPIYLFGTAEQKERCCPTCAPAASSAPSA